MTDHARLTSDRRRAAASGCRQTYLVLEAGRKTPAVTGVDHDRLRPGLNHVAFWAGSREQVVRLVESAAAHYSYLLFQDKHPFAGGRGTYAAYVENDAGFEVKLAIKLSRSVTVERHGRAPCSHQKRS